MGEKAEKRRVSIVVEEWKIEREEASDDLK